jgi:hypothetical protein
MKNKRVEAVKEALRFPHTFPGFYPKAFVSYDGCLCDKCVRSNFRAVVNDTRDNRGPWNLKVDVLWEGQSFCADCGVEMETAYGSV